MAAAARRPKRRYKSAGGRAVCGLESGAGRGSAAAMDGWIGVGEKWGTESNQETGCKVAQSPRNANGGVYQGP